MTLSEQLAEAKTEYHSLMTGTKARVFVDQNGERVEYHQTSAGKLLSYIKDLEAQINPSLRPTGPARVFF